MERYDIVIIGTGPAGLSAAITAKVRNKKILLVGSKDLSPKVEKAHMIQNYLGLPSVSGEKMAEAFQQHLDDMGIEVAEKKINTVYAMGDYFGIQAGTEMFEADSVILATGVTMDKPLPGENEFLGRGVSYCATCDGFLYKQKSIAVLCSAKRYEHEVKYLAELAKKVYLYAAYSDCEINLPNVELLGSSIREIKGQERVEHITTLSGEEYPVDGVFILRTAVAPTSLMNNLEVDGNHIAVNRKMETNIPGCYAAGDCTGRPYQIAKAVGEGNIAAHSIVEDR